MKTKCKCLLLAAVLLLPLSCSTPAKIGYLRDMEYNVPYAAQSAPELRLKVDDRISVQVFSEEMALAAPFNAGGLAAGSDSTGLASTYGVDARGNIEFPVLGQLHVEGMTLAEVNKLIAAEIISRGYIKEPVVKTELENFTITVLGDPSPQVLPVEGNSINLLEVVAQAGGTTEYTKIADIMVIRTEDGQRTAYTVNLQQKDLYDSPVFWLQQNDVVYLKPRGLKLSGGGDVFLKIFSPAIAAISSIAYMLLWTAR